MGKTCHHVPHPAIAMCFFFIFSIVNKPSMCFDTESNYSNSNKTFITFKIKDMLFQSYKD